MLLWRMKFCDEIECFDWFHAQHLEAQLPKFWMCSITVLPFMTQQDLLQICTWKYQRGLYGKANGSFMCNIDSPWQICWFFSPMVPLRFDATDFDVSSRSRSTQGGLGVTTTIASRRTTLCFSLIWWLWNKEPKLTQIFRFLTVVDQIWFVHSPRIHTNFRYHLLKLLHFENWVVDLYLLHLRFIWYVCLNWTDRNCWYILNSRVCLNRNDRIRWYILNSRSGGSRAASSLLLFQMLIKKAK